MRPKRPKSDPRLAVAYLRASKDEQRLSPEVQRAQVEAWAARDGIRVVSWHAEHLTSVAPLDSRPAFLAALASLREHGAGVLVVAKRDRLARDPVLTAQAEDAARKAGAVVLSAAGEGNGTTPADEFMRGVIDSASRYERALIRARTKAALAAKRARGERAGELPFGFRLGEGGRLEPDAGEEEVLRAVAALHAGGLSQRGIGAELARRGLFSRAGTPLGKTQVARILARVEQPDEDLERHRLDAAAE